MSCSPPTSSPREYKMPAFRPVDYGDYKVSMKPSGIRQWFHNIPYLYGTNINFIMTISVENKRKRMPRLEYEWALWRWDGNSKHRVNSGNGATDIPRSNKISVPMSIGYLSLTGHYILDIQVAENLQNISRFEIIANFTLIDRDILTANLGIALLSGLIGAIIVTLIALATKGG